MTRALFLDRDGTLIADPGYLNDPAQVQLLPGVPEALGRAQASGFTLVVVTNQSGIARGLVTPGQLDAVHERLGHLLAEHGVVVEAWAHCPHLPEAGCDCRKPGVGLHRALATELEIDLTASWCIGDRLGDLLPATALGGHAMLVLTGDGATHADAAHEHGFEAAQDLAGAIAAIIASRD